MMMIQLEGLFLRTRGLCGDIKAANVLGITNIKNLFPYILFQESTPIMTRPAHVFAKKVHTSALFLTYAF